jgi:hypothetical protein
VELEYSESESEEDSLKGEAFLSDSDQDSEQEDSQSEQAADRQEEAAALEEAEELRPNGEVPIAARIIINTSLFVVPPVDSSPDSSIADDSELAGAADEDDESADAAESDAASVQSENEGGGEGDERDDADESEGARGPAFRTRNKTAAIKRHAMKNRNKARWMSTIGGRRKSQTCGCLLFTT